MYYFLIPILAGFASHLASAFTNTYSEKFGKKAGTFITFLFRNVLGIPIWAFGYFLAIRANDELLYNSSLWNQIIGWSVIIIGGVIIIAALLSIRSKAAVATLHDSIINTGIYAFVRHPIHCGTFLEFVGVLILYPSYSVGLAFLIGSVWIYLQSRFEEKDLLKRIPKYRNYMLEVPRFIPNTGSFQRAAK